MLRPVLIVTATLSGVLMAKAAVAVWDYADRSFSGTYAVYGGYPDKQGSRAPAPGDMKVAFSVRGAAAKEIFDAIGVGPAKWAPAQQSCSGNSKIQIRQRESLICRHSLEDGYWCTFGFDLSTGLSTWGIVGGRVCAS